MTRRHIRLCLGIASALGLPLLLSACASELSAMQVDLDRHARDFRDHLEADLVHAATEDNRSIEAIAAGVSLAMAKRVEHTPIPDLDQQRDLYVRATGIALQNWLALARHYEATNRQAEARATYHRILEQYRAPRYQPIRERATASLRELDALDPRTLEDQPAANVPSYEEPERPAP